MLVACALLRFAQLVRRRSPVASSAGRALRLQLLLPLQDKCSQRLVNSWAVSGAGPEQWSMVRARAQRSGAAVRAHAQREP